MKKLIYLLLLPLAVLPASAQTLPAPEKKFNLGMGIGAGQNTIESSILSASLDLQGEYRAAKQLSLFSSIGYNRLFSIRYPGSAGYGSLLAGPRAWISNNFFTGIGMGVAVGADAGTAATIFNYNPHIGLNNKNGQFTLGYSSLSQNNSSTGFVQIRALIKLTKPAAKSPDLASAKRN